MMRELSVADVVALAERYPKCEPTRAALQKAKHMQDPMFVQHDGDTCEVNVVERRYMGPLPEEVTAKYEEFVAMLDSLKFRRDALLKEADAIEAVLAKHGETIKLKAAKKRGRPAGSRNKAKQAEA